MSDNKQHHGESYQQLRKQKTLQEILQVAISFEKTAYDFYTALIPKVSKNMRYLVEELAAEEQQHYDLFNGMHDDPEVLKQLQLKIDTPREDHKFSDYIHLPDLSDRLDDQSILQYALGREDAAMKQYQALADTAPDGALKSVFQFLAYEETQHKLELEKKYYEIVHSGGV
ncbi:MAG: ferritin family protein [Pseudomonadota bacterium]